MGLSLAWQDHHGVYIPLAHLKSANIDQEGALPGLMPESGLSDNDLDLKGEASLYFEKFIVTLTKIIFLFLRFEKC